MVVYNYNGMKNDGLILRGDTTLLWQFDGGYVDLDANGTPTSWNYYVTDHLGSTRMVVDSNDSIKEVINYYPFGSEMRMELPAQMAGDTSHPFRFTGKELDRQNGLNMYDFGARLFDVAGVPMWTSVDPLAEKCYNITPYSYCTGDPVNRLDPDGKFSWILAGAIVGAAIEGGIAYYEGKTPREIMGASVKGFIEGAAMCLPYGSTVTAVASSAGAGAVGNISEQYIGTGEVKIDEVFKSSVSGALSGGVGHVTSQAITKGAALAEKTIEQKYSSEIFKKSIKKEIQLEMKQSGRMTSGKSARQAVKKATAHRIEVLKEAEKSELDITSKTADYIQQQTSGNGSDWIINGVFNKKNEQNL